VTNITAVLDERKLGTTTNYITNNTTSVDGVTGKINPVIEKAALALEPGELSDVIPTKYGYEIIKLDTHVLPEPKPFEKVHSTVRSTISREKYREFFDGLTARHWEEAVKEFDLEAVKKLTADFLFSAGTGNPENCSTRNLHPE